MRTSNALFFPLSNGDIKAEIYLANRYYLDGDVWVDIEYSTTTVDIYKEEVDNSISSSTAVLLDLLGIYVVNADTGTFYPNTGDGVIGNNGASNWADSISADSGTITIYSTTSERDSLSIYNNKYLWRVRRAFYSIDTSSIGSSATISDSDFIFTGYRNSSASLFDAYLVEQEQASDTTLVASDFTTVKRTVSGGHVTLSTDSTWTELTIEMNSTAIGWINKSGYTKVALIGYYDYTGTTPPVENAHRCGANFSEDTTYTKPHLEVTYTGGGGGGETTIERQSEFWF